MVGRSNFLWAELSHAARVNRIQGRLTKAVWGVTRVPPSSACPPASLNYPLELNLSLRFNWPPVQDRGVQTSSSLGPHLPSPALTHAPVPARLRLCSNLASRLVPASVTQPPHLPFPYHLTTLCCPVRVDSITLAIHLLQLNSNSTRLELFFACQRARSIELHRHLRVLPLVPVPSATFPVFQSSNLPRESMTPSTVHLE